MKKFITTSSALLAALTISTTALPIMANAAANDATPAATYNSTGTVAFEANDSTDPTNPVDPTDPDPSNPVKPENPDGSTPKPGTAGPLSIDFASSLDFGTNKIENTDKTYYASAQKISGGKTDYVPDYVQVTDNRGTFAGWSVYVNWDGQFRRSGAAATSTTTGDVLKGATLTFSKGTANNINKDITPDATDSITLGEDTGATQQLVMNASAGKGMGTSVAEYGTTGDNGDYDKDNTTHTKSPITLDVPGSTVKAADTYTTNLVWTLSSTPDMG